MTAVLAVIGAITVASWAIGATYLIAAAVHGWWVRRRASRPNRTDIAYLDAAARWREER